MKKCRKPLCLVLLAALLAGCGQTASPGAADAAEHTPEPAAAVTEALPAGDSAGEDTGALPEADISPAGEDPASPAQEAAVSPEPEATAATETAEPRELTQAELKELSAGLNYEENGFFVCTYSRPEEIRWDEVFYNGAGLTERVTPELRTAFEAEYGEIFGDLLLLRPEAVAEFAAEKTGTPYAEARRPLGWTYWGTYGLLCTCHGDTNAQSVTFQSGTVEGDLYRLQYSRADWETYRGERNFVMTAHIRDGAWQYVSNLPADAPAPVTLLDIRFVNSREEAAGVTDFVETEPAAWETEEERFWAVIEARTDGVRYIVDRIAPRFEGEGAVVPEDNVTSGVLNAGERFALQVSEPWFPYLRLTASKGAFWGEYQFGQEAWLNLDRSVPRWLMGHDLEGEGRGCNPRTEADLVNFLMDGAWAWLDPATGELRGTVELSDYRNLSITTRDEAYPIFVTYDRLYAGADEAPDLLRMERSLAFYSGWDTLPDWFTGDALGDYYVSALQLDGEQLLYLSQANDGDGALGYLLPGAAEGSRDFLLIRYQGTAEAEAQG